MSEMLQKKGGGDDGGGDGRRLDGGGERRLEVEEAWKLGSREVSIRKSEDEKEKLAQMMQDELKPESEEGANKICLILFWKRSSPILIGRILVQQCWFAKDGKMWLGIHCSGRNSLSI